MVSDSGWRPGFDPSEMQSAAEAKQAEHRAERHVPDDVPRAADARSLRAWLPILAILAVGFVVLMVLSLPR